MYSSDLYMTNPEEYDQARRPLQTHEMNTCKIDGRGRLLPCREKFCRGPPDAGRGGPPRATPIPARSWRRWSRWRAR